MSVLRAHRKGNGFFVSLGDIYRTVGLRSGFDAWVANEVSILLLDNPRHHFKEEWQGKTLNYIEIGAAARLIDDMGWSTQPVKIEGSCIIFFGYSDEKSASRELTANATNVSRPIIEPPVVVDGWVDAAGLHSFLAGAENLGDWIRENVKWLRVDQYQLSISSTKFTVEGAEHVCMMAKTDLGTKARDRYIEWRKQAQSKSAMTAIDLNDPRQLLVLLTQNTSKLVEAEVRVLALEDKTTKDSPKVKFYDKFVDSEKLYNMTDASRVFGLDPQELRKILVERGHIFEIRKPRPDKDGKAQSDSIKYKPYAHAHKAGYFRMKLSDESVKNSWTMYITELGVEWIGKSILNIKNAA